MFLFLILRIKFISLRSVFLTICIVSLRWKREFLNTEQRMMIGNSEFCNVSSSHFTLKLISFRSAFCKEILWRTICTYIVRSLNAWKPSFITDTSPLILHRNFLIFCIKFWCLYLMEAFILSAWSRSSSVMTTMLVMSAICNTTPMLRGVGGNEDENKQKIVYSFFSVTNC